MGRLGYPVLPDIWQSCSSVLGLVSYLCYVIVLCLKTTLDHLLLPESHHLGFQMISGLLNLFPIYTSTSYPMLLISLTSIADLKGL